MSHLSSRSWVAARHSLIVTGLALVMAGVTYVTSVEILVAINRARAAARPEIENWIMPHVGTAGPSLINAAGVFLIALAIGAIIVETRASTHDRKHRRPSRHESGLHDRVQHSVVLLGCLGVVTLTAAMI